MVTLLEMPLVLGTAAFLAGYILAKLGTALSQRSAAKNEPMERDRHLRSIEAELRVAQKKLEEAQAGIREKTTEAGELREELEELRERNTGIFEETTSLRNALREECEKTQKLRTELSERAEQSIRAEIKLRDVETELSLAQAGSDAVHDEIRRLAEEREELTDRLKALQAQAAADAQVERRQGGRDRRRPESAAGDAADSNLALDC